MEDSTKNNWNWTVKSKTEDEFLEDEFLEDIPPIKDSSHIASVGSYNYPSKNPSKDVSSDIDDKYNEQLVTLQEEVVDIATNKSKALEYISRIDETLPSIQDENKIKFNVLQALCCLIYSEGNQKKDMSLCEKGMNIAKKAYHADEEANIIYYCLKSLCIDNDQDNVLAEQQLISEQCHLSENHCKLFKCKFYAEIRFSSLCETAKALENKNRILDAISIYKLITDLPDNAYKSFGLSVMGRLYTGKGIDKVKGVECVREAADLVDYTGEFDANNFFHLEWLKALTNSSWSYYSGDGNTPVDYRKAYKQAMLASNLGSAEAMETVGEIYQYCDQYKEMSAAIKWYKKSAELGCEVAQAKLKELEIETTASEKSASSETSNLPSEDNKEELSDEIGQERFYEMLNLLLNDEEKIIATVESALDYINMIQSILDDINDIREQSKYYFLQALCCYYYVAEHVDDIKEISKKGEQYIDKALQLDYNDEYKIFKLIFKSYNVDHNSPSIFQEQKSISNDYPDISKDDTILKDEYLLKIYEDARHDSLIDSCIALEEKELYREAEKCWNLLLQLTNSYSKFVANYYLYSYYLAGKGDIQESAEKCCYYCKKVLELYDFEEDFDSENINHQEWLECLSILGSSYLDGDGVETDYAKGWELSLKAARLGDMDSMFDIGEAYELGKGVEPDLNKAIEWYKKSAELGCEDAEEKLKELKADNTSSEQEYIEEIKYCLEEDEEISPRERRLLEKLRIKLGITEERAKELEESLLAPALTDDEKEYLEEYKECAADGEITAKDRRLLDKLRKMLGISEERAKELETL